MLFSASRNKTLKFRMEIVQVSGKETVQAFHELPLHIYKNDKNWVPPLRMMIEDIFDPGKMHGSTMAMRAGGSLKMANNTLGVLRHFMIGVKLKKKRNRPEILVSLNVSITMKLPRFFLIRPATG
jgi:hypothetical protein